MVTKYFFCTLSLFLAFGVLSSSLPGCASSQAKISSSPAVFQEGTLERAYNASAGLLHEAVLSALKRLHLNVLDDRQDGQTMRIATKLGEGTPAEIGIDPVGPDTAKMRIHVGSSKDEAKARTLLYAVESELISRL